MYRLVYNLWNGVRLFNIRSEVVVCDRERGARNKASTPRPRQRALADLWEAKPAWPRNVCHDFKEKSQRTARTNILLNIFNFKIEITISQNKSQIVLFTCVQIGVYLKNYALLSRYCAMQIAIFLFTWLQNLTLLFTTRSSATAETVRDADVGAHSFLT